MTIEQTKAAIAVMQAYVDGKEIEHKSRGDDKWDGPTKLPSILSWDWDDVEYRVKPTPIEGWVNVYPGGSSNVIHESRNEAIKSAGPCCLRTIKVRKVEE